MAVCVVCGKPMSQCVETDPLKRLENAIPDPAQKRRGLAERLLETFRVSFAEKTVKVPCDCVDLNGVGWPDCTCSHGWRKRKIRDVEGTIAAIERVLEEEGK